MQHNQFRDKNQKSKIKEHTKSNVYWFGDRNLVPASKNVDIQIFIGNQHVMLNTDIVVKDIPLILSHKSMKKADITLDFENDQAVIFGESAKLS